MGWHNGSPASCTCDQCVERRESWNRTESELHADDIGSPRTLSYTTEQIKAWPVWNERDIAMRDKALAQRQLEEAQDEEAQHDAAAWKERRRLERTAEYERLEGALFGTAKAPVAHHASACATWNGRPCDCGGRSTPLGPTSSPQPTSEPVSDETPPHGTERPASGVDSAVDWQRAAEYAATLTSRWLEQRTRKRAGRFPGLSTMLDSTAFDSLMVIAGSGRMVLVVGHSPTTVVANVAGTDYRLADPGDVARLAVLAIDIADAQQTTL